MRESDYSKKARHALLVKKSELKTWRAVAKSIGFNAGYLLRVTNGARQPSNRLLIALGLPPRAVLAPACARCGEVHTSKRCTKSAGKYKPHPVIRLTRARSLVCADCARALDEYRAEMSARLASKRS